MSWLIHRRMAWKFVSGKVLLLDLDTNRAAGLNETGALVWQLLEEGAGREALAAEVAGRYRIPVPDAERDVDAFLALLERRGWIEARPG